MIFDDLIYWINTNQILAWLILYLIVYIFFLLLGYFAIGSWWVGMVVGIGIVNGISIAFASFATQTQPLWITACIFLFTGTMGAVVTYHLKFEKEIENISKQGKDK